MTFLEAYRQSIPKVVSLLGAFLLSATPLLAATRYSITDLGDLPGGDDYSSATALNDFGQVVGYSANRNGKRPDERFSSFLWSGGSMIVLSEETWRVHDINNQGVAVGGENDSSLSLLWQNGMETVLPSLPGENSNPFGGFEHAYAVNDAGQIAGVSSGASSSRGYVWDNGIMTELGDLPGGNDFSFARAINNVGQVAGYSSSDAGYVRGFIWQEGVMTDLGAFPDGDGSSEVLGMNDHGQIVGYSYDWVHGYGGFLWENGVMTPFGDLPGGQFSMTPWAINNSGQIVGSYSVYGGGGAFYWDAEQGTVDLTSALDASGDGWLLGSAFDINSRGQIVGQGRNPDGAVRAFLLTPVPEPSAHALLCVCLTLAGARHRWRS